MLSKTFGSELFEDWFKAHDLKEERVTPKANKDTVTKANFFIKTYKQNGVFMSIYSRLLTAIVIAASIAISACTTTPSQTPEAVRDAASAKPALKNYTSYDLAYPYYKNVYDKLVRRVGPLKNRGEAHITLISPPEFKNLTVKNGIKPERIHQLTNEFVATQPQFTNNCLGHFEKDGQHVYYVVVDSQALFDFRKQIAAEANLPIEQFDPNLFFPHVTIGFTKEDMHYEQGARKNAASCPEELKMVLRER